MRFHNAGWGGDTAAGGLKRLERDVFAQNASVLIVAYGVNDIGWGARADEAHKKLYLESIRGIVEQCKATIDLLLTDVIMPLMNGHELAKRLKLIRPGTRVLYMSGYMDDMLELHGVDQPKIDLIEKPFTAAALAEKLRGVLAADETTRL